MPIIRLQSIYRTFTNRLAGAGDVGGGVDAAGRSASSHELIATPGEWCRSTRHALHGAAAFVALLAEVMAAHHAAYTRLHAQQHCTRALHTRILHTDRGTHAM